MEAAFPAQLLTSGSLVGKGVFLFLGTLKRISQERETALSDVVSACRNKFAQSAPLASHSMVLTVILPAQPTAPLPFHRLPLARISFPTFT